MKPTSPLSLLFFLQLASALPLPTKELILYDCRHSTCHTLSKPNTPPTKLTLSEPHFPSHQLSSPSDLLNEVFDNSVRTPSPKTPPSRALSSSHPLSSSYLLSLSQAPSQPATTSALPSKPTSELPNLRKEDAQRYWASQSSEGSAIVDFAPSRAIKLCGHGRDQYLKIQGAYLARQYSDLIVVGIVVLFLAVVVALEACERCGDLRQIIFGTRRRRGEIYLEDSDSLYIVKKPFYLQPAPPPRYKSSPSPDSPQEQYHDEGSDIEVEGEGFSYDSDAYEKV